MTIRYLTLCLTTGCNLFCRYCYHGDIEDAENMTEDVLYRAMKLVESDEGDPVHIQMTGGEPALVPDLVKLAVRLARSAGRTCTIGIQTNGTGLTLDLADFFRAHEVQVGVSLDGPPQIHQKLRGCAALTMQGLMMLEERGIPFRVTTVVTAENVMSLDRLVLMLSGFRMARGIALDLLVLKGRAIKENKVKPAGIETLKSGIASMIRTLDTVNSMRDIPISLRELDLLSRNINKSARPRIFCHAANGNSVAVHTDGRLFPCGQTLGQPEFQAGTVWEPLPEKLGGLSGLKLESAACSACPVSGHCPGECPSRLMFNRGRNVDERICELYRILWNTCKEPRPDHPFFM